MMPLSSRFIPLALWCVVVFILSSIPGNMYPRVRMVGADKLVHVGLYSIGGVLAGLAFYHRSWGWLFAVVFCALYGVSDEIHQLFVPRRSFALGDIVADAVGGVLGVAAFYRIVAPALRSRLMSTWNNEVLQDDTKGVRST